MVQGEDSDTFEMWLVSADQDPVPLRAVNGSWSGSATNEVIVGFSNWGLKNGTNSINPSDFPTVIFPQWNSNVTNDSIMPSVNYNLVKIQ